VNEAHNINRSTPDRDVAEHETERNTSVRILRLPQVINMVGLKKTAIYQLQAQKDFPESVQLTPTAVGWIENEVLDWLAKRIASRARSA